MAILYFKVSSDWQEVVRLRQECEKLESQLKKMDSRATPTVTATLEAQLASTKQQMMALVTEAAKAGTAVENDFKKKIYDASQTVNDLTEKIISQKNVVKDVESDVKRLGETYRIALKSNPIEASSKKKEYDAARKALDEERAALFGLAQQQAEARLSVKRLRDEYSLYKQEAGETVEVNDGLSASWKKMLGVIGGITALRQLGSEIIRVRGEFQSMQAAIETMVGKETASGLMAQLKDMAKISPLTLTDMVDAEKMMLGFNIQAEDSIKYLQALSDVSMGDANKFKSLTLAFSQMSAAGKLMGQDLNQMINAGFNPLQTISEKTGKSIATLKDEMSKGAVSAEMVQRAFIDATSAGGKFYQMSENASKTINGQISMMQDALDNAFNEIGQSSEDVIMKAIKATTSLIQNYDKIGAVLVSLITTYGVYRGILLATIALEQARNGTLLTTIKNTKLATAAQAAFNKVAKAHPYALIASLALGAATAVYMFSKRTSEAQRIQENFNAAKEAAIRKEEEHRQELERLISVANDEAEATLNRNNAIEALRKAYPGIIEKYIDEEGHLTNLIQLRKELNEEQAKRKEKDIQTQLASVRGRVKNQYEYVSQMTGSPEAIEEANETLKELQSQEKELQKEINANHINKRIEDAKRMNDDELKKSIAQWKASLSMVKGDTVGEFSRSEVESFINSLETLQSARNKRAKNKTYWEAKKKEAETARDALDISKKNSEEWNKYTKQIQEAQANIDEYSDSKQDNDLQSRQDRLDELITKQAQERVRRQVDLENQVAQADIDAMVDGEEKKRAQRELDDKKELQAIERQKEEYKRKVIQEQKEIFEAQEELKAKQNPNYRRKTFDESSVSVDTSPFDTLMTLTRSRQVSDQFKANEEAMNRYLKEYGTFMEKRQAITDEYSRKIAEAGGADTWEGKLLQKEFEEALSSLNLEELKESINWELVFSDLSGASRKSLEEVKRQLRSFRESAEYKDMAVDQKKVVDEALNKIQDALIDKGGLLGDLPDQLNQLRAAQEELIKAREEYNDALRNGTDADKEAARKKLNEAERDKENAESGVNKAAKLAAGNLTTLANAVTELGSSSEMTLSQLGGLIGGLTDAFAEAGKEIGGIIGSAFSLLDSIGSQGLDGFVGNALKSVFNAAYGAWDTVFGWTGIDFGGESDERLAEDIERLTASNQDLERAVDGLSEKMEDAPAADVPSIYAQQRAYLEQAMRNTQEMMRRSGVAHSDGFMGMGGEHSSNKRIDEAMSAADWRRVSDVAGRAVDSAADFWSLTSEEMGRVADGAADLYAKIKGYADDGHADAARYMDEYIQYYKQLEALDEERMERLTSTSFDSVKDDFRSALLDMESDAEAFADSFEEMMRNAVLEDMMKGEYDNRLKEWYRSFSGAIEGDGLDAGEQERLREQWQAIVDDASAQWQGLKDAFGWDDSSSGQQSATSRAFGTEMTQEQGAEISGRLTALYESGLRLEGAAEGIYNVAEDARSLIAQSYLELQQISENTGAVVKPIKQMQLDIAEMKRALK